MNCITGMTLKEKLNDQANRKMTAASKGSTLADQIHNGASHVILNSKAPNGTPQWEHDAFMKALTDRLIILAMK
jgi:hypothetical protein